MTDILKKITCAEKEADDFGFKWADPKQILEQIKSECKEVEEALAKKNDVSHLQDEIGDLIHATLSLCLYCGFTLEETLEKNMQKFEKRFVEVVRLAQEAGYTTLTGESMDVLMEFWDEAKKRKG